MIEVAKEASAMDVIGPGEKGIWRGCSRGPGMLIGGGLLRLDRAWIWAMVVISSVAGEDDRVATSEFGGATVGLKV